MDLSDNARISNSTFHRIIDLHQQWKNFATWPSAQVASLVREVVDKHPRPIPTDLANDLADWEERGMNM